MGFEDRCDVVCAQHFCTGSQQNIESATEIAFVLSLDINFNHFFFKLAAVYGSLYPQLRHILQIIHNKNNKKKTFQEENAAGFNYCLYAPVVDEVSIIQYLTKGQSCLTLLLCTTVWITCSSLPQIEKQPYCSTDTNTCINVYRAITDEENS